MCLAPGNRDHCSHPPILCINGRLYQSSEDGGLLTFSTSVSRMSKGRMLQRQNVRVKNVGALIGRSLTRSGAPANWISATSKGSQHLPALAIQPLRHTSVLTFLALGTITTSSTAFFFFPSLVACRAVSEPPPISFFSSRWHAAANKIPPPLSKKEPPATVARAPWAYSRMPRSTWNR